LLEGIYDGETTYGELKQHDGFGLGTLNGLDGEMVGLDGFGLGTLNGLDGEMVGLDGKFYQVKTDGIR